MIQNSSYKTNTTQLDYNLSMNKYKLSDFCGFGIILHRHFSNQ